MFQRSDTIIFSPSDIYGALLSNQPEVCIVSLQKLQNIKIFCFSKELLVLVLWFCFFLEYTQKN